MVTVKSMAEVPAQDVSDGREIVGVTKQVLIGPAERAPTFAVRRFTLAPGGHTPAHAHPFEHGVVVLRGKGTVLTQAGPVPIEGGSVVFVPPGEHHQFRAGDTEALEFLCIVPVQYEK
ncbi:MAG: cupin domain-containing protein [Candidatus Bipolaricaulota bacterium]|nr:cupin domain-containing protein [Candidatus Bipolaricaulota bacterium]